MKLPSLFREVQLREGSKFFYRYVLSTFLFGLALAIFLSGYLISTYGVNLLTSVVVLVLFIALPFFSVSAILLVLEFRRMRINQNINDNIHTFVTYLSALATSNVSTKDFFGKVAENPNYGVISEEMRRLYNLAVHWGLGFAEACKVVARHTPNKIFSKLLMRMGHAIEFGESMEHFTKRLAAEVMNDYKIEYEKGLYNLDILKEIFTSLLVVASFFSVFVLLIPFFTGISPMFFTVIIVLVLVLLDIGMYILVSSVLPPDRLEFRHKYFENEHKKDIRRTFYFCFFASMLLFIMLSYSDFSSIPIRFTLSLVPFFLVGKLSESYEEEIREMESIFPSFIKTLGTFTGVRAGAVEPVLKSMKTHNFGKLTPLLKRLYKRLIVTKDAVYSWLHFGVESGSDIVFRYSNIFIETFYMGGDPIKAGELIPSQITILVNLRKKRIESARNMRNMIYGMFLGLVSSVFISIFISAVLLVMLQGIKANELIAMVGIYVPEMIDLRSSLETIYMSSVFHALMFSLIIKKADGGVTYGAMYHFVILVIILAIAYFASRMLMIFAVSNLLGPHAVELLI